MKTKRSYLRKEITRIEYETSTSWTKPNSILDTTVHAIKIRDYLQNAVLASRRNKNKDTPTNLVPNPIMQQEGLLKQGEGIVETEEETHLINTN